MMVGTGLRSLTLSVTAPSVRSGSLALADDRLPLTPCDVSPLLSIGMVA